MLPCQRFAYVASHLTKIETIINAPLGLPLGSEARLHNRQQQPQVFIPLLHDTRAHVQLDRGLTAPVQSCGNEQTTMTTTHDSKPMTGDHDDNTVVID